MPTNPEGRALLVAAMLSPVLAAQAQTCTAHTQGGAATIVELYTSEGCNSCPPADRWLSSLKPSPQLVALAFHVDYWDYLGWSDRYASRAYTQRQAEQQRVNGSRYSYTPQVVVNGADRKDWSGLRATALPTVTKAENIEIRLTRDGDQVNATVRSTATRRLAAYWAVTEMGHSSAVRAGENRGVTLQHDHVVREFQSVAAWPGTTAETGLTFRPQAAASPAHPRRISLVVLDADTGRPLQGLSLGC